MLEDTPYFIGEGVTVTFPFTNILGHWTGYQKYNIGADKIRCNDPRESRYFTRCPKGNEVFFGYHSLGYSKEIYITEGVFDAISLHGIGKSALALASNDPKHIRNTLSFIRRPLIAMCDGDEAGLNLKKFTDHYVQCPEGKDANDLSKEELLELIKPIDKRLGQ